MEKDIKDIVNNQIVYTSLRREVIEVDAEGNVSVYELNNKGQKVVRFPNGATLTYTPDYSTRLR